MKKLLFLAFFAFLQATAINAAGGKIDRHALVNRNSPHITASRFAQFTVGGQR